MKFESNLTLYSNKGRLLFPVLWWLFLSSLRISEWDSEIWDNLMNYQPFTRLSLPVSRAKYDSHSDNFVAVVLLLSVLHLIKFITFVLTAKVALTGFMRYFICCVVFKKVDVIYICFLLSYNIELYEGYSKSFCYERLSIRKNKVCLTDFVHKYPSFCYERLSIRKNKVCLTDFVHKYPSFYHSCTCEISKESSKYQ